VGLACYGVAPRVGQDSGHRVRSQAQPESGSTVNDERLNRHRCDPLCGQREVVRQDGIVDERMANASWAGQKGA
jgi:hypothetical protein